MTAHAAAVGLVLLLCTRARAQTGGDAARVTQAQTAADLVDAVDAGLRHIAFNGQIDLRPVARERTSLGAVLPIQPGTLSLGARCHTTCGLETSMEGGLVTSTDLPLFQVLPGARVLLYRLEIHVFGTGNLTLFTAHSRSRLWLSLIKARPTPEVLDAHYKGARYVNDWRVVDAHPHSQVLLGDSYFVDFWASSGPLALVGANATVAFQRTQFYNALARDGTLFATTSCLQDAVRLVDVEFTDGFSTPGLEFETFCRQSVTDALNGCQPAGGEYAALQLSEQFGQGLCAPLEGPAFLNGLEADVQEGLPVANLPPFQTFDEPLTSCVRVDWPEGGCEHMEGAVEKALSHNQLTVLACMVTLSVLTALLCTIYVVRWLCLCSKQRRLGEAGRGALTLQATELQSVLEMGNGDTGEDPVFLVPRDTTDCDCKQAPPGDPRCLLCPKCSQPFAAEAEDGADRRPKALFCGHSVCAECAPAAETQKAFGGLKCDWGTAQPSDQLPVNYAAVALLPVASDGKIPSSASRELAVLGSRNSSFRASTVLSGALPERPARGNAQSRPGEMYRRTVSWSLDTGCDMACAPSGLLSFASQRYTPGRDTASPDDSKELLGGDALVTKPAVRWQPDEESLFCTICCGLLATDPPAEGEADMRPVVFPCGHGACATCASEIRRQGSCYERCQWTTEQHLQPFSVNKLVVSLLRLAASQGGSVVLTLSKRCGHKGRDRLAQELQSTEHFIVDGSDDEDDVHDSGTL